MNTLVRLLRTRPRLLLALLAGALTPTLLPAHGSGITRLLVAWNVTVWSYLALMGWLMARASHVQVRRLAEQEDRGAVALLALMTVAAVASLAAIVLELATVKALAADVRLLHYALTAVTILGSWFLLGILFTLHYARVYYQSPAAARALRFPDAAIEPNYWDFLYFSFTIAVAAQTSDISVTGRPLRKAVLVQSVLSFLFNVAILGLSINLAAGLVGA